jgi:hypothetical protein
MCNSAGRFKVFALAAMLSVASVQRARAQEPSIDATKWDKFAREVNRQEDRDYYNGISYIISGGLALAGGIWGANIAEDSAEKGVYTLFQTIGVASVGYGAYIWKIGGEERSIYRTLESTRFTPEQKTHFLRAYRFERRERERRDRFIRAITHGMIAGLNIYNASQQKEESIKSGLYFIGGVNLLAAISFTFEF